MAVPGELDESIRARLSAARLLALDVDGVLTDGRVTYMEGESEAQTFYVPDGQGLVWLVRAGIDVVWITGRGSEATRRRARELGVTELHTKVKDKAAVLAAVQKKLGVTAGETVAMGDDLPDLALARNAALFAAPANARDEVKARAQIVTRAPGGSGAVRELTDHILRAHGAFEGLLDPADS